jgi:hypothetical protein
MSIADSEDLTRLLPLWMLSDLKPRRRRGSSLSRSISVWTSCQGSGEQEGRRTRHEDISWTICQLEFRLVTTL